MKISREDNLPEDITLNIELGADDVEPYLEDAYRKVVARLRIPGFRPGKAPSSANMSLPLLQDRQVPLVPEIRG